MQYPSVSFRKLLQNLLKFFLRSLVGDHLDQIEGSRRQFGSLILVDRNEAVAVLVVSVVLSQHVPADGQNKRTEFPRLPYFLVSQGLKNSNKRFLLHVLDGFTGLESRTEGSLHYGSKVLVKVLPRKEVAPLKATAVFFVKGVELQQLAPGARKWHTV